MTDHTSTAPGGPVIPDVPHAAPPQPKTKPHKDDRTPAPQQNVRRRDPKQAAAPEAPRPSFAERQARLGTPLERPAHARPIDAVRVALVDTKGTTYRLGAGLHVAAQGSGRSMAANHLPRRGDALALGGIAFLVQNVIWSYSASLTPHVTLVLDPLPTT